MGRQLVGSPPGSGSCRGVDRMGVKQAAEGAGRRRWGPPGRGGAGRVRVAWEGALREGADCGGWLPARYILTPVVPFLGAGPGRPPPNSEPEAVPLNSLARRLPPFPHAPSATASPREEVVRMWGRAPHSHFPWGRAGPAGFPPPSRESSPRPLRGGAGEPQELGLGQGYTAHLWVTYKFSRLRRFSC